MRFSLVATLIQQQQMFTFNLDAFLSESTITGVQRRQVVVVVFQQTAENPWKRTEDCLCTTGCS